MAEERAKVRVVRCPKCDKLLPELANFTVYRCGGCNATLQAKKRNTASEDSSERSDGETLKYSEGTVVCPEKKEVVVSDASSVAESKVESAESRNEGKKLPLKDSPMSDHTRNEDGDALKQPENLILGETPIENGKRGRESEYGYLSEAPIDASEPNIDSLVQGKVEEKEETKLQVESSNGYQKVQHKQTWRNEDRERAPPIRRPVPYPDEGPSNYHRSPAKRQNIDGPSSAEYLDQDRAELLRKLDELRDQLKRSCEVAERPTERPAANRSTTFSSNPYARNGRNNWFPEGSSSLNRSFPQHPSFINGHSTDMPNLYPAVLPPNGVSGFREAYGPHSLGRAPIQLPGQFQRPMSNCLYGQFDPDPLVSYHHDGFYHQPACSCLHCYNSHWPSLYNNQRVQYPVNNHGFYQADGPSVFGPQNYSNKKDINAPLHPNEQLYRQRPMFLKKDGHTCRPIAGAAPFVSCYNCFELLQLPEDILIAGKIQHKLRCGSCSHLISFEYDGRRLLPSAPLQTTNATCEHNNDNGYRNRHQANSRAGSFDSTGYDAHSADEKLVLPSYPVSSEMVENEYGFHMSESEKMQGLSSSCSTSEDAESPGTGSMICQRDLPNMTELLPEAEGISRVPSLPLHEHFGYPLSNQVIDGAGTGSRSRRTDQEKSLLANGNFKQNSVKDVPVVTEMESPIDEYPDVGLSQESWDVNKDEDQPRTRNNKFFAGLIKRSFRSMESGRCKVSINGHPISDRSVKKAEKLAGPVHPGDYWYDYRAGFWGIIGHACLGIIPPFIDEFNYPMSKNCAGGNTGVLVNGRELHQKDLTLLVGRGLPPTAGRSYIIEISGKVWDEATGEELDSLGRLAPTIEKVKHGFGMRVPRLTC